MYTNKKVMNMPFDYYEILKQKTESKYYIETTDLVRKTIWSESYSFKLSVTWLKIEDVIRNGIYLYLRYN